MATTTKLKPDPTVFAKRSLDLTSEMQSRMQIVPQPVGNGADLTPARPAVRLAPRSTSTDSDAGVPKVDTPEELDALAIGQVALVALHLIVDNKRNARFFYLPTDVDETATSMQQNQQLAIATGWVESGKLLLKDGQMRGRAARAAGLPYLKVDIVATPEPRVAYLTSRAMNTERRNQTCLDDAVRWHELLLDKIFSDQADLATAVGVSVPVVSKTLSLNAIPMRLLHKMKESAVTSTLRVAYEIGRIFASDLAKNDLDRAELLGAEVIDDVIKKGLSADATRTLVDSRLSGPKRRVRAEAREVRFGEARGQLKVVSEKGILDLSFKGLTSEQLSHLTTLVEGALRTS